MTFELISFDADQTLFDFKRVMHEAHFEVAEWMQQELKIEITADGLRDVRDQISDEYSDRAIDMLELRRQSFKLVLKPVSNADALVSKAMEIFTKVRFGRVYLYPSVKETLSVLKQSHTLALLTNGNSDPEKAGFEGLFDYVLLGEKFAFKKPDPRIFQHLFGVASIDTPKDVLHVGDNLLTDVLGANSAGARSVWFNPDKQENTTGIDPHYVISDLADLKSIV